MTYSHYRVVALTLNPLQIARHRKQTRRERGKLIQITAPMLGINYQTHRPKPSACSGPTHCLHIVNADPKWKWRLWRSQSLEDPSLHLITRQKPAQQAPSGLGPRGNLGAKLSDALPRTKPVKRRATPTATNKCTGKANSSHTHIFKGR